MEISSFTIIIECRKFYLIPLKLNTAFVSSTSPKQKLLKATETFEISISRKNTTFIERMFMNSKMIKVQYIGKVLSYV